MVQHEFQKSKKLVKKNTKVQNFVKKVRKFENKIHNWVRKNEKIRNLVSCEPDEIGDRRSDFGDVPYFACQNVPYF